MRVQRAVCWTFPTALLLVSSATGFNNGAAGRSKVVLPLSRHASSRVPTNLRFASEDSSEPWHWSGRTPPEAKQQAPNQVSRAGKSALVLGWFGAKENELEFVRKLYERRGYTDVVVEPSVISACSKPRGWYRSVKAAAAALEPGASTRGINSGGKAPLAARLNRRFDRVHAMSGGFLNLYLQLVAGARLEFDSLVLDSTPILPTPQSFTRFSRAYMATLGRPVSWIPKLVPLRLHLGFVTARWTLSSAYVALRVGISRAAKRLGVGRRWCRGALPGPLHMGSFSVNAMMNRYGAIVDDCVDVVFGRPGPPLQVTFVTNPEDPYLNYADVRLAIDKAKALGCAVKEVQVPTPHVKAIFRKPAAIFESDVATVLTAENKPAPGHFSTEKDYLDTL